MRLGGQLHRERVQFLVGVGGDLIGVAGNEIGMNPIGALRLVAQVEETRFGIVQKCFCVRDGGSFSVRVRRRVLLRES